MQTVLLVMVALAAGFFGGYLALTYTSQQEKTELRGVVDELLSELRIAAEESCGRLIQERTQLEQLVRTIREDAAMVAHIRDPIDSTDGWPFTAPSDVSLQAESPLWAQVTSLAAQGKSCAQVAKELNLGLGEVELILKVSEPNSLR